MKQLIVAAVVVCVALTGCGKKASEAAVEKMIKAEMAKQGVKGDVDISDGKVTVTTKEGTATYTGGPGAAVPAKFPKDVPVYDGAAVMASTSVPDGFNLLLQTKDPADKVVSAYSSKMTANGWTEEMNSNQGGQTVVGYKKDERTAVLIVASADEMTQINLTVAEEKSKAKQADPSEK